MAKRSTRLEDCLQETAFDTLNNPKHMAAVDFQSTPKPIARLFYESGDGNYPQDQDAHFQPPGQDAFALAVFRYCRRNTDDRDKFTAETRDAWMQRCKKAWASLVRDVHFAFLMFESQEKLDLFDTVEFSLEADIQRGADLIIENVGQEYHVNLFVDSKKSRKFLDKKKKHRQDAKQAIDIEVPMTFRGEKKRLPTGADDLWLYNRKHVKAVNDLINGTGAEVNHQGTTLAKILGET